MIIIKNRQGKARESMAIVNAAIGNLFFDIILSTDF